MAGSTSSEEDAVFRLLCHLAWLRKLAASERERTAEWAFRVYNSAVHLQFHFVYPHHEGDRVRDKTRVALLAARIESVVELSRNVLRDVANRDNRPAKTRNVRLDSQGGTDLHEDLMQMIHAASDSGWRERVQPQEYADLDEVIDPLVMLKTYKRSPLGSAAIREAAPLLPEDPMADFNKGLAAKTAAEFSPHSKSLSPPAREVVEEVADAVYASEQSQFVHDGGSQAIDRHAARLVRRPEQKSAIEGA